MPLPLVYHPDYVTPLPDGHRFPMPKFGAIYKRLVADGIASIDHFRVPVVAQREWLTLVHEPDYVTSYLNGTLDQKAMRRIGFPWSPALVNRTITAVGGTVCTAQLALTVGLACNTAGGTHHAHPDFGSGYCIFNDIAVAARYVIEASLPQFNGEKAVERVLIIDLDVHQGDGTAAIFKDDPSIFTFSVHCDKNFPFRKQKSDLDIGLPVDAGDVEYMGVLHEHVPPLLDDWQPHLVLYDAGVDPHETDRLGKLNLSDEGLASRDLFVLKSCAQRGIPVATVVGGGYDNDIDALGRRHSIVFKEAQRVFDTYYEA